MARPPLLIIYQWALRMVAFLLLHQPRAAGKLRLIVQADTKKQKKF